MRLEAVDDVVVALGDHHQSLVLHRPEEDVATVAAADDVVVAPEGGLLYLKVIRWLVETMNNSRIGTHLPQFAHFGVP